VIIFFLLGNSASGANTAENVVLARPQILIFFLKTRQYWFHYPHPSLNTLPK